MFMLFLSIRFAQTPVKRNSGFMTVVFRQRTGGYVGDASGNGLGFVSVTFRFASHLVE